MKIQTSKKGYKNYVLGDYVVISDTNTLYKVYGDRKVEVCETDLPKYVVSRLRRGETKLHVRGDFNYGGK